MVNICLMGTCRTCNLKLSIISKVNKWMHCGCFSNKYLLKDDKQIEIYCQPINYTTKLKDIRDSLYYLNNLIYSNKNPNNDLSFFKIFFRGMNMKAFEEKIIPKPGQEFVKNNDFDMYIFEICSIKEILFNTNKYGNEYNGMNLPWNISIDIYNQTFDFSENEFIMDKFNIKKAENNFKDIIKVTNNKPILVIGPYTLKEDTNEHVNWGESDVGKFEYVNNVRIKTQDILKNIISKYDNVTYFDMSKYTNKKDIMGEHNYHFNDEGQEILISTIKNWIKKHL